MLVAIVVAVGAYIAFGRSPVTAPTSTDIADTQTPQGVVSQVINGWPVKDQTQPTAPAQGSGPVAGMSKYTDIDFGFSFWYPSAWKLEEQPNTNFSTAYPGGTVKKRLVLRSTIDADHSITIEEYSSPTASIRLNADSGCPGGICDPTLNYFFDASAHTWMMAYPNGFASERGDMTISPGTTKPADVRRNTMGGLHIFNGGFRNSVSVVPLSAHNFVIVSDEPWNVGTTFKTFLINTIVALDPDVATPISDAEQRAVIQSEANAYGVKNTSTATKTYTNDTYGFSFQYPDGVQFDTTATNWSDLSGLSAEHILTLKTNGPVTISISASADPGDVGRCMVVPQASEESVSKAGNVTINGLSFLKYSIGDAAMGHYTNQDVYDILHNNRCYRLIMQTESTRTESDAEAQAQQSSIATAKALLQPVLDTFRFTSDTSSAQPPTCTLSSDNVLYKLGDVITLTWKSQGATRALWNQNADEGQGTRSVIIPPEGTPGISGTAQTIANIEGYQPIKLQVVGPGGFGTCSTNVSVSHSDAKPSITVDSIRFTPDGGRYSNDRNVSVTLSGTATNGGLFNNEVNLVLFDPTYQGPYDEASIYRIAFDYGRDSQFYSGGSQPGVREDSLPFKRWSVETFVPRGVSSVRVLAYYPYYSAGAPTSSNAQPIVNKVLTITQ